MRIALAAMFALSVPLLLLGPAASQEAKSGKDAAEKPTEEQINTWMQQKTNLSQRVMEGLTEADFDKIQRGAVLMNVLSYFEGRSHSDNPDYKRQLSQFDFANRELVRMAMARNLEGATLAFNQLTVSCVYCHKTLRDAQPGK